MLPAEAEALFRRLHASTKGWTTESAKAFVLELVDRQERIAAVAIQECIDTFTFAPTWSEFKQRYDKEARRTAQDADKCAICEGSAWEFISDNTVRECRCRIKP